MLVLALQFSRCDRGEQTSAQR